MSLLLKLRTSNIHKGHAGDHVRRGTLACLVYRVFADLSNGQVKPHAVFL